MSQPAPFLETRDLSFFRGIKRVLYDINITLLSGTLTTLVGPNGAGKTSLLRLLLGLLKPTRGQIIKSYGLSMGYVPQTVHFQSSCPLHVDDFLDLTPHAKRTIDNVLTATQSLHLKTRSFQTLSGGERQRILMAKALRQNPSLLILDEPLQGLDFESQQRFYHILESLKKAGTSILMASHDLHTVMACSDYVLCLNGHICCAGKPAYIAKNNSFQALFPGIQRPYSHHHDHHHES